MSGGTALILVNLGTPDSPTARGVRRFLRPFLSDRRVVNLPRWFWLPILYGIILPFRSPRVARLYQKIWWPEGSPLKVITERQTQKLGDSLGSEVRYAMMYGEPSLSSAVNELIQKGIQRAVVLPLYPQFCSATTGSVCDQLEVLRKHYDQQIRLGMIKSYHDHPAYIQALADSVTRSWQDHGKPQQLLFSFHGIPQALIDRGDPYFQQCHETASLVAERLALPADFWQVCFQSRFGKAEWAKPYADRVIGELPARGIQRVDVLTPAFASDCLETLEEIAVQNAEHFVSCGGEALRLIPCLNDDAAHIALLAALFEASAVNYLS
jgi:ferrochelatase